MIKLTALYGHPTSPGDFEKYYSVTHLPLVDKMKGLARAEYTKFVSGPDGAKPAFYRMAELYFDSQEQMAKTMDSAEAKAVVGDIPNFATGGVTIVVGSVDR